MALKKGIAVIHVEGGLRSFGRSMPEPINCPLTDQISDLLFVTAPQTWTTPSRSLLSVIRDVSSRLPLALPMHPRTRAKIDRQRTDCGR